ncbi:ABC transporter permease [Pontibacillus salicampi]|uniref:ABC transporter permease n=1 Tax=Pontibacillus salicampi TaxID=1449801 RepID=A0ABV6LTX0_9BACI
MINLIKSDLYKLKKTKSIKVLFIIMWIAAIAVTVVSNLLAKGTIGPEVSGPMSGLSDVMTVAIVGPFLAAIYLCGDFDNKTINDAISSCGVGRGYVIVSKAIVYYLLVMLMLIPYMVVTLIAFSTGAEFAEPFAASVFLSILGNQSELELTSLVFGKMFLIMLVMIIAYASQMTVCVFLSFLFRKSSIVIFVGFGLILVLQIFGTLGIKYNSVERFLSFTPFSIGNSFLTMDVGTNVILKGIGISLLFCVWILSMTNGVFRKSEVK